MILGSCTSARQIEARCCMPPESCQGSFFSNPSSPTSFNSALARGRYSSRGSRFMSIGSITLARMLRHGSSSAFWNTMPTLPCGFVTFSPSTRIFARCRRQQARDQLEQRGLAAAGWADHDEELAVVDVEVERPQRRHVAVARPVGLRHAGQLDARRVAGSPVAHQSADAAARSSGTGLAFDSHGNSIVRQGPLSHDVRRSSAGNRWCRRPSDSPWPWRRARHTRPSG